MLCVCFSFASLLSLQLHMQEGHTGPNPSQVASQIVCTCTCLSVCEEL